MSLTPGGDGPEDRRPNLTPTLALRVAIVGSVVLALFAIVFFRLWFLQVLTGHQYVLAASHNHTRVVALTPQRGEILASDGQPLVTSTTALALQIAPSELPVKVNQSNMLDHFRRDDAVYRRLAHLLRMRRTKPKPCKVPTPPPSCDVSTGTCPTSTTRRLSPIACKIAQSIALNFYADVTIKQPVSRNLQYYIAERSSKYRGVQVEQTSVPGYPFKELAAQTLGAVGRLTTAEQRQRQFKGVNANAVVGQSGLEYEYDQYLRGRFGKQRIMVNASGVAVGHGRTIQPTAGANLKTTLNLKLQQVGQSALQTSIDDNGGLGGAFVALDPQSGAVYGMGSLPSYDPKIFTKPVIPTKEYQRIFGPGSNSPQFNRATQSQAPDGSTFKAITATAALQSGQWSTADTYTDSGEYCPPGISAGSDQCRHNAGHAAYGTLNLTDAIKVSDDVFFYHLGALLNDPRPKGGALQEWAKRFGIGQNPHIDLPSHQVSSGILPTPAWYDHRVRLEEECETATGVYRYTNGKGSISARKRKGYHRSPKHPFDAATGSGGCGIGTPGTTWTIGQNINMAVGQGDVELSPLQLALAYSAIENGGKIVRPHVGDAIENADGTVLQKLSFPAQRHLPIDSTNLAAIQEGLHEAAQSSGGTSYDVMGSFGMPVYGKTGTAQYFVNGDPNDEKDYSWYVCYVPASATSKPIAVVVWVEGGGFGDVAAAPVAREILSQWFYGKPGQYVSGSSSDH